MKPGFQILVEPLYVEHTLNRWTKILEHQNTAEQLEELSQLGNYIGAIQLYDDQPNRKKSTPEITLAIARALCLQGNFKKANTILQQLDSHSLTPSAKVVVEAELARLEVYLGKEIASCVAKSRKTMVELSSTDLDPVQLAHAQYVHACIMISGLTYSLCQFDEVEALVPRLHRISDLFKEHGSISKSLYASMLAIKCSPKECWYDQLISLAESAENLGKRSFSAVCLLEWVGLSRRARKPLDSIRDLLSQANTRFEAEGHHHGQTDVAYETALVNHDYEGEPPWEAFQACLEHYEKSQYFRGLSIAILEYGNRALHAGDIENSQKLRMFHDQLSEDVGMGLSRAGSVMSAVDMWMRVGEYGAAIETCLAELDRNPPMFLQASLKVLLSSCHAMLSNTESAFRYSENAENDYIAMDRMSAASDVALKTASDLVSLQDPTGIDLAEKKLRKWIEKDQGPRPKQAIEKLVLLAQLNLAKYSLAGNLEQKYLGQANDHLLEAEAYTRTLDGLWKHQLLGKLFQTQSLVKHHEGKEVETLACQERARNAYSEAGMLFERANMTYLVGSSWLNQANRTLLPAFDKANEYLHEALDYYQKVKMRARIADTRFLLAMLYTNAYIQLQPNHSELIEKAMKQLIGAESELDLIRQAAYAGETVVAVQGSKQNLVFQSSRVYQLALNVLCKVRPDPELAWQWVQRAKARSLSDILGEKATTPAAWYRKFKDVPGVESALKREEELVARINLTSASEKIIARKEVKQLRLEMEQHPLLKEYLKLRSGRAVKPQDLGTLSSGQSRTNQNSPLYIDWVQVHGWLYLCSIRPGKSPRIIPLQRKIDEVESFFKMNLDGPNLFSMTMRTCPQVLDQLNFLVEPLGEMALPEDLLVFCPTGILNRLPLHLLKVGGEYLIQRHPLVYSPSLSVTRHCILHRKGRKEGVESTIFFGDPNGDRPQAAKLVNHLSRRQKRNALLGAEVTKQSFLEESKHAHLVHFQGHAVHLPGEPLKSYLRCADGQLTAEEIFSELNTQADLIVLAACESAASAIKTGDEPLGLIPAFLYAGARSILATQWPVSDSATAKGMSIFYDGFFNGSFETKAHLLRDTVLQLRSKMEFSQPYYWAPFTLHGDWL